ncbi:AMP-binding protein [Nocardioides insulae]|uniref:AMP-binding protein n=1 Tax=Nocardioides insulae TaxID=394734 RepID=UPI001FE0181F|nr:AMP-binding protein [Nocardioides insulae]
MEHEPSAPMAAAFEELTPVGFLRRAAEVFGDRTAILDGDFTCTYAEFHTRAGQSARLLADRGVSPGDRVAVLAPNSHLLLEAHYSVPLCGAVLVALNTRLAAVEVAHILDHSGATVLLVDSELTELAANAVALARSEPLVITDVEHEASLAGREPLAVPVTDERGLLSINYTSGTTGDPKGVMYHHRGAYLQALAMAYHARLAVGSVYLWTLPMFHTNGWCFPWAVTAAGATHRCLRRIDPTAIWQAMAEGVTHFCAAPTVLAMLLAEQSAVPLELPLETEVRVFAGGAPPWPALIAKLDAVGISVEHLYGLTETFGPAVVCIPKPEWSTEPLARRAALIARQGVTNISGHRVRVVDADGADVVADGAHSGEIILRGNTVMLGYYRDPAATARATTADGWFRTGDVGVMHPDGYVEIRDRIKDVIISGGENISSVEVERALTEHPEVNEAAVVGRPHPTWGEVPVAFVQVAPDSSVTVEGLIEFARGRLAGFKIPREIVFGALPKTSTGKVQKNVLRERD